MGDRDHFQAGTYARHLYLPGPGPVLCPDRNRYGSYFHFRFFLYICELAQHSLKGSYAHRDEPHDSFQKVTELDC